MPQLDKDGFILVKHTSGHRSSTAHLLQKGVAPPTALKPEKIDVELLSRKIDGLVCWLAGSSYMQGFISAVDSSLSATSQPTSPSASPSLLCYGLGHVATAAASQYQLALLLLLRKHLRSRAPCEVYDPIFWPEEVELLQRFGCSVLDRNENCARRLTERTLVYMPHCESEHYEALLRANWHPDVLPRCLLVGNSFSALVLKLPPSLLAAFPLLERISRHVREVAIVDRIVESQLFVPFNDTAVHCFPAESLRHLAGYFWNEPSGQKQVAPLGGSSSDDEDDDGVSASRRHKSPRRRRRKKSRNYSS